MGGVASAAERNNTGVYGAGAPVVRGPVPVDVFVPLATRCVVITGRGLHSSTSLLNLSRFCH